MEIGFALTQHCNLRCPHCIRDDVTTVQSLSLELIASILAQSRALFGAHSVSFTGGEPLLHPEFGRVVDLLAEHGHPYRFVSNGWHLTRALKHLDRHAPSAVRLSLSGATAEVHDAERGRGSFHRVLLASGVLTSRGDPDAPVARHRRAHACAAARRRRPRRIDRRARAALHPPAAGGRERDARQRPRAR